MAVSKKDRQTLYEKYAGRCAYCGCVLGKSWHVDEIEPIVRIKKRLHGYSLPNGNYVPDKWINSGCEHPERLCIENQNPACPSCNINKHSDTLENFRIRIAAFMKHLNEINTQYKIAKRFGLITETNIPVIFYFEKLKNETI